MAFLIISENIENTINSLRAEKKDFDKLYRKTGQEIYKSKSKDYSDKIQAAERYSKLYDQKTCYEKIKYLKTLNVEKYKKECTKITKGMKGIYFDKRTLLFRVQITRLGERLYLGQFDTPDDALEILKRYI